MTVAELGNRLRWIGSITFFLVAPCILLSCDNMKKAAVKKVEAEGEVVTKISQISAPPALVYTGVGCGLVGFVIVIIGATIDPQYRKSIWES